MAARLEVERQGLWPPWLLSWITSDENLLETTLKPITILKVLEFLYFDMNFPKGNFFFKHLRIEIVGYFHQSILQDAWISYQGKVQHCPRICRPKFNKFSRIRSIRQHVFFRSQGCYGIKPLPANFTQQIHDRIHESQKWEAEFLEASDQKHAVGDGQPWGHQDGVWSADGSHGPS